MVFTIFLLGGREMDVIIDVSKIILTTPRLILRAFKETDLDDFFEYAKVDGVGQMAGWLPHKNKEETKAILDKFINHKNIFAIVKDNKVIGSLGLHSYRENEFPEFEKYRVKEIGFVLSKEYWGQGIMPEAVKKVIDYLFNELDIQVLFCGYWVKNPQSKRVQEKCGFKFYKSIDFITHFEEKREVLENILINPKYVNKLNFKGF